MKRFLVFIFCLSIYSLPTQAHECPQDDVIKAEESKVQKAPVPVHKHVTHKKHAKKAVKHKTKQHHVAKESKHVERSVVEQTNPVIEECQITPDVWQLKTPPTPYPSNNLRRQMGSTEFADGAPIIIDGNIFDNECVPISDAVIEIWQANAKGGLDYLEDANGPKDMMDRNFNGSGSTVADNLGYYRFLTVMPGSSEKNSAPHINIRVKHKDFDAFESVIYFENQAMNISDAILTKAVDQSKRNLLVAKEEKSIKNRSEAGIVYRFNITLDGKNKFKKY